MAITGIQNHIPLVLCENGQDAESKGHSYREGFTPLQIERAVVVKDGTESHRSTVDFVMRDDKGNRYIVMLTGALVRSIPTEFAL